jgi:hypothetical protein
VFLPLNEDYSTPPFAEVDIAVMAALSRGAGLFEEAGDGQTAKALQRLLAIMAKQMEGSASNGDE